MSNSDIQPTSLGEADDFGHSELRTKEYWESRYDQENKNFKDIGDIGEIWFGEDSVEKMVNWALSKATTSSTILDIGCGNGHLLLELASHNFTNLYGIDYSSNAIRLANDVARSRGFDISYYVADLFNDDVLQIVKNTDGSNSDSLQNFDFILDKGTFDAISLSLQQTSTNQLLRDIYPKKIRFLLNSNGYFLITSCNFTKDELIEKFKGEFDYCEHIKYPTFTFGGVTGQTISTQKAHSIIDALPGNSLLTKTGYITVGTGLVALTISKELYVFNEETVVLLAFIGLIIPLYRVLRKPFNDWAEGQKTHVNSILEKAQDDHKTAVKERINSIGQIGDIVDITQALFSMSKETAKLEAEAFELKQKAAAAAEVKSVLDSWVRYETSLREREQKDLANYVIERVMAQLRDEKA
ncbi:25972_t:CDS:2 [Dentiscutata erythropus]|uniref:Protein-lysine N-methyltransferase EFM4 n=1 Tax=Dentiscutata erythropus TaxID=1348616 RepID=A0A9N9AKJ5_9GLOM|nr:25972_t:CDS:2 [Dentiscutata erythropus]